MWKVSYVFSLLATLSFFVYWSVNLVVSGPSVVGSLCLTASFFWLDYGSRIYEGNQGAGKTYYSNGRFRTWK